MPDIVNGIERAPCDGSYPATKESWFCPGCGRPSICFTSFYRIILCFHCAWAFHVVLRPRGGIARLLSDKEAAERYIKAMAEQQVP